MTIRIILYDYFIKIRVASIYYLSSKEFTEKNKNVKNTISFDYVTGKNKFS